MVDSSALDPHGLGDPDGLDAVRRLLRRQPEPTDDRSPASASLERLCRAAAEDLGVAGVGICVLLSSGEPVTVAASGTVSRTLTELELTLGEGPALEAHTSGHPVLLPDLAATTSWPGYTAEASGCGVAAVFAFPLRIGAVRLGSLVVHDLRTGPLPPEHLAQAMSFADLGLILLVDGDGARTDDPALGADDALRGRLDLYQAQGMVMVQLGVDLDVAMARLRAHAFAHDLALGDVARDVVARRLTFEPDPS